MRILLIAYDNDSHIAWFPLGLAYIAAALRNDGHDVEIYQQDIYHYSEEHLTEYLTNNIFDIVGVGGCGGYYQYRKIKQIAHAINEVKNKPLFWMGGHLPSPEPEYFLRKFGADFVVIGEGEESVKELVKVCAEKGDLSTVDGIAYLDENQQFVQTKKRALIEKVDEIPWPAWDLFNMEHYVLTEYPNSMRKDRGLSIISGRGCPFRCNFCYRMDEGFRPRSAQSIIDEMIYLRDTYKISYIEFDDELLMSSVARTKEICQAMLEKKVNMKWNCSGRLNYACKDLGMLQMMKSAGCVFINYGIESIDDQALKNMNKNLTTKMIIEGVENTLKAGISPGLNIIFGNIGETRKSIENDVEFLFKYDDHAQNRTIRPVTPYPGTDLYQYALEKGMINNIEDFYENKHLNSDLLTCNFTELSDEEYYEALAWANTKLLENHLEFKKKEIDKSIENLYVKKDINFRGFRTV
ncbi:MAG: radical SAM protein [Lachnospiraceae bacterium]